MDKLSFPVIGWIYKNSAKEVPKGTPGALPLLDIPFMSDEKWLEITLEADKTPEIYRKAG